MLVFSVVGFYVCMYSKQECFKDARKKRESFPNPKYISSLGFLERVCLGTLGNSLSSSSSASTPFGERERKKRALAL